MKRQAVIGVLLVLVLTVAVIAGAVSLLGSVNSERDPAPAATGPLETVEGADGERADVPPAGPVGGAVPDRPDCPSTGVAGVNLPCLGGEGGSADGEGEISVVNVWAWWCGPCRDELPHFQQFADENPAYDVVGVHLDANAGNGAAFLNELDLDLPSYQDADKRFVAALGLPGVLPVTVVIVDGEQVAMFPRAFDSVAELEDAVTGALGGAA